MTWVWKYNKESRLQIGASSDYANICSRATFHARQNSPFTRPWSAQSYSATGRPGCWPKGRKTNCSYLRGRFSKQYACPKIENGVYWRMCNHELDKEFNSPNALNVTKTSRLRYADHMIRRPEPNPMEGEIKEDRNLGSWIGCNSLVLGVRDWTHCAKERQSWKDLLQQALTKCWL
jgi:hypothetical protein